MKYLVAAFLLIMISCKFPYNAKDVFKEKAKLPQDEAPHIKNSLEWWYFTGHLKDTVKNKTLGVEYVVFHFNPTNIKGGWMINLAVSDPENKGFYYDHQFFQKRKHEFADLPLNFSWNKKEFESTFSGQSGTYSIAAKMNNHKVAYKLNTTPEKEVVLHDGVGYENYGDVAKAGYYTYSRLNTTGSITVNNDTFDVSGDLWYDRQWNCSGVFNKNIAWDWFSIQFEETNSELMLYSLYNINDREKLFGGTYTDSTGESTYLETDQIEIAEKEYWSSSLSGATYPIKWNLKIADLAIDTDLNALFSEQELSLNFGPLTKFFYWEGMCKAEGKIGKQKVIGNSYVEMTNRFRIK